MSHDWCAVRKDKDTKRNEGETVFLKVHTYMLATLARVGNNSSATAAQQFCSGAVVKRYASGQTGRVADTSKAI